MLAFTLKPGAIDEFIRRIELLEVDTVETRTQVLLEMADEGYMLNVVHSKKSPKDYAQDLKKNFNVLDLTDTGENNG